VHRRIVIEHVRLWVLSDEVIHLLLLLFGLLRRIRTEIELIELSRQCIQISHLFLDRILSFDEQITVGFGFFLAIREVCFDGLHSLIALSELRLVLDLTMLLLGDGAQFVLHHQQLFVSLFHLLSLVLIALFQHRPLHIAFAFVFLKLPIECLHLLIVMVRERVLLRAQSALNRSLCRRMVVFEVEVPLSLFRWV